jgi:hypothetical protein
MPPNDGTLISWETPDQYKYNARALTLESEMPTASTTKQKTIIKIVSIIMDEPNTDEDGTEYYTTFCLSFDKAYIDGGNVDYVISNKTIDEIAQSFADGLNLE